jgi:hypothetical protein
MQFSCQRNSDLIELTRHKLVGSGDGLFAGEVEGAMHTITAKRILFARN